MSGFRDVLLGGRTGVNHKKGLVAGHSNKKMVPTLPARGSFDIIARHQGLVLVSAVCRRSGRGWAAHFRR